MTNVLDELINSFSRLPGVGKKNARRIVNFLLMADSAYMRQFSSQIAALQERIRFCSVCGAYTEEDPCPICSNSLRNQSLLCVVAQSQDVQTIEESHEYYGLFHVLGGLIAPLEGVGLHIPSIDTLVARVKNGGIREVILAINPTVEGDTTALYIQQALSATDVAVTRLASGVPVGGDLEYADRLTLARSFRGRTTF
jgi:recombination protein RecR